MKGFAIFTIVLSVIGMLIGIINIADSNQYHMTEMFVGVALLPSGFLGILLSCAVIALADIRDLSKSKGE
jgi:hypothetical protein